MRKTICFGDFDGPEWPAPEELKRYFLAPKGQEWSHRDGDDTWGLYAEGLDGTEHLTPMTGRVDVRLFMCGHPDHGVHFAYTSEMVERSKRTNTVRKEI